MQKAIESNCFGIGLSNSRFVAADSLFLTWTSARTEFDASNNPRGAAQHSTDIGPPAHPVILSTLHYYLWNACAIVIYVLSAYNYLSYVPRDRSED